MLFEDYVKNFDKVEVNEVPNKENYKHTFNFYEYLTRDTEEKSMNLGINMETNKNANGAKHPREGEQDKEGGQIYKMEMLVCSSGSIYQNSNSSSSLNNLGNMSSKHPPLLFDDCALVTKTLHNKFIYVDINDVKGPSKFTGELEFNNQKVKVEDKENLLIQFADKRYRYCKKKIVDKIYLNLSDLKLDMGVVKHSIKHQNIQKEGIRDLEKKGHFKREEDLTVDKLLERDAKVFYRRKQTIYDIKDSEEAFKQYKRLLLLSNDTLLFSTKFLQMRLKAVEYSRINSTVISFHLIQLIFALSPLELEEHLEPIKDDLIHMRTHLIRSLRDETADKHTMVLLRILSKIIRDNRHLDNEEEKQHSHTSKFKHYDSSSENQIRSLNNLNIETYVSNLINTDLYDSSVNNHRKFFKSVMYFKELSVNISPSIFINFCANIKCDKHNTPWYNEILTIFDEMTKVTNEGNHGYRDINFKIKSSLGSLNLLKVSYEKMCKYFYKNLKEMIKHPEYSYKDIKRLFDILQIAIIDEFPNTRSTFLDLFNQTIKNLEIKYLLKYFKISVNINSKNLYVLEKIFMTHHYALVYTKVQNEMLDDVLNRVSESYVIQTEVAKEFKERINNT